jgi:hypothetical protein
MSRSDLGIQQNQIMHPLRHACLPNAVVVVADRIDQHVQENSKLAAKVKKVYFKTIDQVPIKMN